MSFIVLYIILSYIFPCLVIVLFCLSLMSCVVLFLVLSYALSCLSFLSCVVLCCVVFLSCDVYVVCCVVFSLILSHDVLPYVFVLPYVLSCLTLMYCLMSCLSLMWCGCPSLMSLSCLVLCREEAREKSSTKTSLGKLVVRGPNVFSAFLSVSSREL